MRKTTQLVALLLSLLLVLEFAACNQPTQSENEEEAVTKPVQESSQTAESQLPQQEETPIHPAPRSPDPPGPFKPIHPYLKELANQIIAQIVTADMGEYERAKAAFDYLIEYTVMDDPIGLDLWRIYGGGEEPISFVEQRALSVLRFGVGGCEDYAAALTILLREMGLEAEYVPGLTYSLEGNLVDHAWTKAKIDGVWYHLDSQLEDNISHRGTVRYRYFMRGDATLASHRWGQNLISSGLLTSEQNDEIAGYYLTESCPQDHPTPEPRHFEDTFSPNIEALREEASAEIAAYEAENGPLPPMELNTIPPVFGLEGFGPPDEG